MFKKFFQSLILSIFAIFAIFLSVGQPVYASSDNILPGRSGDECGNFLGFISWDCNVTIEKDKESLKSGVWTIVANILTDLTVAAAYLVLGFVIYGGYLYTMSSGDPGKIASGKKTLTNAFIGLAIVLLSNIILNSIRLALGGANLGDNCAKNECVNPTTMVVSAIQWAIAMIGIVSAIFVVYGGISYTTSAGDPGKLKKAKDTILYALIGLAIVAFAEVITAFVSNAITSSKPTSFLETTNNTTISKEVHENSNS